jgi:hypothetical protein
MDWVAHANSRTCGGEGILDHVKRAIRDMNRKLSHDWLQRGFKVFTCGSGEPGSVARASSETLFREASA